MRYFQCNLWGGCVSGGYVHNDVKWSENDMFLGLWWILYDFVGDPCDPSDPSDPRLPSKAPVRWQCVSDGSWHGSEAGPQPPSFAVDLGSTTELGLGGDQEPPGPAWPSSSWRDMARLIEFELETICMAGCGGRCCFSNLATSWLHLGYILRYLDIIISGVISWYSFGPARRGCEWEPLAFCQLSVIWKILRTSIIAFASTIRVPLLPPSPSMRSAHAHRVTEQKKYNERA